MACLGVFGLMRAIAAVGVVASCACTVFTGFPPEPESIISRATDRPALKQRGADPHRHRLVGALS